MPSPWALQSSVACAPAVPRPTSGAVQLLQRENACERTSEQANLCHQDRPLLSCDCITLDLGESMLSFKLTNLFSDPSLARTGPSPNQSLCQIFWRFHIPYPTQCFSQIFPNQAAPLRVTILGPVVQSQSLASSSGFTVHVLTSLCTILAPLGTHPAQEFPLHLFFPSQYGQGKCSGCPPQRLENQSFLPRRVRKGC